MARTESHYSHPQRAWLVRCPDPFDLMSGAAQAGEVEGMESVTNETEVMMKLEERLTRVRLQTRQRQQSHATAPRRLQTYALEVYLRRVGVAKGRAQSFRWDRWKLVATRLEIKVCWSLSDKDWR